MAPQDPEDWELPLTQVLVQFSQPSTFRRHLRDEEHPFERHTQPRLDPDPQQAPLASLKSLHPSARTLIIVLKSEAFLIDGHQVVFEGSFENNNEVQTVTRFSDDKRHRLYLQGPLNHLSSDRRAKLHWFSASPDSRVLACLSCLASGFRVFAIIFSSYICGLSYYFGWLKSNI